MTDLELQQLRREKWRLDGKPIRTIEQARVFLEEVGFCLMYPKRPPLLVPTFIGAFVGSEDRLPGWQHAFKDPRAAEATELMVRLLRERTAFEANLFLIYMRSSASAIPSRRPGPDRALHIPRWPAMPSS
jgi:hypothetical protein